MGVEVEVVLDAEGEGGGMDDAGGGDGRVPVLKLRVSLDCDVVGEVVVEADAGRVDRCGRAEVLDIIEYEAGAVEVHLAATDEEVDIRVEAADGVLDFGAEEEAFLAADVAAVDGIGAANLEGGAHESGKEKGEVGSGGDAEIFAAFEIGESAGGSSECRELEFLGSGGDGLCDCGVSQ